MGLDMAGVSKRTAFVDFSKVKFVSVMEWLKREKVESVCFTDLDLFLDSVGKQTFDLVVVNLLMGGVGPFEMIRQIRMRSANTSITIIVLSKQVQKVNIYNAIKAGANDFVAEPFDSDMLFERVRYHLSPHQEISPDGYESSEADAKNWQFIRILLEGTELLSRSERNKEHEVFYRMLKNIADALRSNRTSLIIVDSEAYSGLVLASSDDPKFYDFPITLQKYPEILHVMHTGHFVLIEDVGRSTLIKQVNKAKTIDIGSLMVFPVRFENEVIGVLTVRRPRGVGPPSLDVMRVLQAIANTMASHSNVRLLLRKLYKQHVSA